MLCTQKSIYQNKVGVPPIEPKADSRLRGNRHGRVGHIRGVTVRNQDPRQVGVEKVVYQHHPAVGRGTSGSVNSALRKDRVGCAKGVSQSPCHIYVYIYI